MNISIANVHFKCCRRDWVMGLQAELSIGESIAIRCNLCGAEYKLEFKCQKVGVPMPPMNDYVVFDEVTPIDARQTNLLQDFKTTSRLPPGRTITYSSLRDALKQFAEPKAPKLLSESPMGDDTE